MIFTNSRYTKTPVYEYEGNLVFRKRKRFNFTKFTYHRFIQGDRLDSLAHKYYGDSQLWWVFLDANPQYRAEIDIKYGDIIKVPTYEEVMKCLK